MRGKNAFTLAEVLITLAIIGVVAAMTIPTLVANYQNKMFVSKLKKAQNVAINGFKLMLATEGVELLATSEFGKGIEATDGIVSQQSVLNSINDYLSKYIKIVSSCYGTSETSCAIYSKKMRFLNEEQELSYFDFLGVSSGYGGAYFTTPDGITYMFLETGFVNGQQFSSYLVIDVNSESGPNILGRDIFMYYILDNYERNLFSIVPLGPTMAGSNADFEGQPNWCGIPGSADVSMAEGMGCAERIIYEGWQMTY